VDPEWGNPPEIALVYAVGESAMDTGFKGRYTSRTLRKLGKEKNVKAIVLRADSPGGDALAADLIARQMKETSEDKPVIVTQGDVAGSGGYWISMYGDPIYSSPFTITGSIGVIGGWIWNDGLSDKTGLTSDHVQVGDHADLGFGITIPLLGAQIPDRNLDTLEHARMERSIRGLYSEFTQKVADGRQLDQAFVDSVGQGRVWAGRRAIDVKLVDKIGGLEDALADARQRTGLTHRRHVKIGEYPKRGLFALDELMSPMSPFGMLSRLFGQKASVDVSPAWKSNYEWRVLEKMAQSPGKPLLMVPPEDIPADN
jgi:protease-4